MRTIEFRALIGTCFKHVLKRPIFHVRSQLFWSFSALLFLTSACSDYQNPNNFVDPFIGTGAHGHTYPGATRPFGMIQPGPVNGTAGWDWVSGYHYSDSVITGFAQTHLSGTGIGDLNDVLIQPVSSLFKIEGPALYQGKRNYASRFSHDYEKAEPGYYSVLLLDSDINAEMTSSDRVAMYRFSYPKVREKSLIIDLGYSLNWDRTDSSKIAIMDSVTIAGYRMSSGWARDQRIYFVMRFSEPFALDVARIDSQSVQDLDLMKGSEVMAKLNFKGVQEKLLAKVAISAVSEEGALGNLETYREWDFEELRVLSGLAWQKELEKIRVSGSRTQKTKFYTALYHTKMAPVLYSDQDLRFRGGDGKVYKDSSYTRYTIFSLWDTFRAQHPLLTLTDSDRVNDLINTMLGFYKETGYLPVWELHANETNTMTGYHAIPVILDAYRKGFRGFDAELAFEAMKASAMQDQRDTDLYREYQYIPSELGNESVTKTLEYAYDDWCIAQMALLLNRDKDFEYFNERSGFWRNVYDEQTKFMRGKTSDGEWVTPFDPLRSTHRHSTDYTEGNAWQHNWFVPHDVEQLINEMGGDRLFTHRLDSMFQMSSLITGEEVSPDISGMIGQYAHGNEPSHHIAYLYNYAGEAWKTQARVQQIMDSLYTTGTDGLSGNEDAGQMSAWYVFSAMGFYPVNPANSIYVIGSPNLKKARLELPDGKNFTITARNLSEQNIYIQSVTLNGNSLERSYITHDEILKGGVLNLEMSSEPNKNWAKQKMHRPPNTIPYD